MPRPHNLATLAEGVGLARRHHLSVMAREGVMDEKKDWLDSAREPSAGSWQAVGFVLALVAIIGGAAAFFLGMFGR